MYVTCDILSVWMSLNSTYILFILKIFYLSERILVIGHKIFLKKITVDFNLFCIFLECGKNYLINEGGMIDFQLSSSIEGYQYDCTWLIKKQPEFDKVYMKIIKFRTDTLRMYLSGLFFF